MTELKEGQPIKRQTAELYRSRTLTVTLHPRFLQIAEKGRRDVFSVPYSAIYEMAQKLRARQEGKI